MDGPVSVPGMGTAGSASVSAGSGGGAGRGGGEGGGRTRDPAAQPERTGLAWRRTALAFLVCLALAIRSVLEEGVGGTVATVALALGLLAWLALLRTAHRRIRAMEADRPEELDGRQVRAMALCTLVLIVVGGALLW